MVFRHYGRFVKGKDLETDANVSIKMIDQDEEVNILKDISNNIKNSLKIKEIFTIQGITYIVEDYFDGDLEYYRKFRCQSQHMSPNLIKKIFMQLNVTFKELLEQNIIHNNICPRNIYIKYTNRNKTNFDSFLTGYGYYTKYKENHIIEEPLEFFGTPVFQAPEVMCGIYKKNSDLFSIGMTIYFLYFGKIGGFGLVSRVTSDILNRNGFKIEEDRQLEDLLKKLLKEDPDERINWEEYFDHPFFKQYYN